MTLFIRYEFRFEVHFWLMSCFVLNCICILII
ncbi:hypothetical protein CUMW_290090 [Citrus unshiu]|uniref:Uncharacterized protein n=1 Tax=Citrus unshiu TaxID=55188 RepID=A0A2H5QY80_CITUN|nr:hypothetical protein CUMW_290090 [Citrus unshiu]